MPRFKIKKKRKIILEKNYQMAIMIGRFGMQSFLPTLTSIGSIDGYKSARRLWAESGDQQDILGGVFRLESDHFESTWKGWKVWKGIKNCRFGEKERKKYRWRVDESKQRTETKDSRGLRHKLLRTCFFPETEVQKRKKSPILLLFKRRRTKA